MENNEFICKELAVINIKNGLCISKLIKPPCLWTSLNRENQENASWLTKNYHKLKWYSGNDSYNDLPTIIENLLAHADKIYVKCSEKVCWLQKYLHKKKNIVNLEDLNCPKLSKINKPINTNDCNLHANNCAVRNVKGLLEWFRGKYTTFKAFESFYRSGGILNFMFEEEIAQLPMEFIMVYATNQINSQWKRFPKMWRENEDFQRYRCCKNHNTREDGDVVGCYKTMIKDCIECNTQ